MRITYTLLAFISICHFCFWVWTKLNINTNAPSHPSTHVWRISTRCPQNYQPQGCPMWTVWNLKPNTDLCTNRYMVWSVVTKVPKHTNTSSRKIVYRLPTNIEKKFIPSFRSSRWRNRNLFKRFQKLFSDSLDTHIWYVTKSMICPHRLQSIVLLIWWIKA